MEEIYEAGFTVPIKTWLPREDIEPGAMEQLRNAASHPEAALHLAVMPDCHVGAGVTIGSVFPTANAVLPNAVGVDIGCGMCAIDTGVPYDRERMDRNFWRHWSGAVARNVPTGFSTHRSPQDLGELDRPLRAKNLQPLLRDKAAVQIGTLGGGNHFLEAQVDERGIIWLMVHSGSRHTGLRIATHYEGLAQKSTERRGLSVGKGLASLPLDDQLGQDYLEDMAWATDFALENRKRMIAQALIAFDRELEIAPDDSSGRFINIHHNFAALEEHGGELVMVHRKGATSAANGQIGIIPGSMGAPSYIVRGRGNEESHRSCSHGAGRAMSRGAAKKQISEAEFQRALANTFSKPSTSFIDEAPQAYKNIDTVINRQLDLIEIVHTLTPIITVKGDSKARED